jgi:DNA-binding FadR family transcriptional regulator
MLEGCIPAAHSLDKEILLQFTQQQGHIIDYIMHGDAKSARKTLLQHFEDKERLLNTLSRERKKHEVS